MAFTLHTRVTATTYPKIEPYIRRGDILWGRVNFAREHKALTFGNYDDLANKTDTALSQYSIVNLDGEYQDWASETPLREAVLIREYVTNYNLRHPSTPIDFHAFYHLRIIRAHPEICRYPTVVMFGKSFWAGTELYEEAQEYIKHVIDAGRTPGVLLGSGYPQRDGSYTFYTNEQVLANFNTVVRDLGLDHVAYYYPQDSADALIHILSRLRRQR